MGDRKLQDKAAATLRKATALHESGALAAAQAAYTKYLKQVPDDARAMGLLAVVKFQLGFPVPALDLMQRATKRDPTAIGLRFNHAKMLIELGRHRDAEPILKTCTTADPSFVPALNMLGVVRLEIGDVAGAIAAFMAAAGREPRKADHHVNLAVALARVYRFDEAEKALAYACDLAPGDVETALALAKQLYVNRKVSAAQHQYRQILVRQPDNLSARAGLLLASLRLSDWRTWEDDHRAIFARLDAAACKPTDGVPSPYLTALISDDPAHGRTAGRLAAPQIAATPARALRWRRTRDRIRVAYVSADYREHATSYLVADLIEQHARDAFEIVGISYGPDDDSPMRSRMEAAFDAFHDVPHLSAREIAAYTRGLEVDIAIDLQGFNQYNRMEIFAARAAPIQVLYLGWPGTSGTDWYDYILADRIVIPPGSEPHVSEAVVRLPGPYQPNDRRRLAVTEVPSRAECGLPETGFVFSCFNNPFKILPDIFDIWMRILHATPGSVLWLLAADEIGTANLRREATARGIDPARLVFADLVPNARHLARHRHVDLVLDTRPYNAHTTASDALWNGVPVLTCPGRTFAASVAASLVCGCGLDQLAVATLADYEATAIRLAHDPAVIAALKAHLIAGRDQFPLFDTPRIAAEIEAAYRIMVDRFDRGQAPTAIDVTRPVG